MLTCAHNCYHKHYNGDKLISGEEVQNLKFCPSPSGEIKKIVEVRKVHYLEDYAKTKNKNHHKKYDFAILELAEDLSDHGCFGVDCSANNYQPDKQKLILAGYPKGEQIIPDAEDINTWRVAMQWDHNEGQEGETIMDEEFMKYKIQAAYGNSGGPVFKEEEGQVYIVGIHIGGSEAKQLN